MYIANCNIGKYKKGDIVPDETAQVWAQMYLNNPTDLVPDKIEEPKPEPKKFHELDLNRDGVVDNKDKSLAGKVLRKKVK